MATEEEGDRGGSKGVLNGRGGTEKTIEATEMRKTKRKMKKDRERQSLPSQDTAMEDRRGCRRRREDA